jgi:chromosome segregation ATPase
MSEINDAANAVRSTANTFRALLKVGDFLDRIVSLENLERETKDRISKVVAKDEDILKRSEEANAFIEAATVKAAKIISDAKAYAQSSTKSVEALAEEILGDAKEKAKEAVQKASAKKDALETEIGRLKAEAASLTQEVNAKGAALLELKNEKAKLLAKLS